MADTKRDIIGRIQTIVREIEASAAFASCGRSMGAGADFVTLVTADAAAITTAITAYAAAAP